MATGHFPIGSQNFTQCGFINHDEMATVTLQTTYDPTLSCVYPKVACPLEISSGSGIYSDVVSHLPVTEHRLVHRVDIVYRDVITRSRDSRDHHYHMPPIFRVKKYSLPVNNAFFIATVIVVKDATDNPDCQGLGDIWKNTICVSTCARTMPPAAPTIRPWMDQSHQQSNILALPLPPPELGHDTTTPNTSMRLCFYHSYHQNEAMVLPLPLPEQGNDS